MNIPIEYFASRGIQQERTQDFRDSFFSGVYRQAFDAIASVVLNSKSKQDHFAEAPVYDVQNTVAFMGRRGTGKTSAMLSVFNALQYSSSLDLSFCQRRTQETIHNTVFVQMPRMIDASHLEDKEDLFEVLLACMVAEINEVTGNPNFNEREYGDMAADLQNRIATMQNNYDSLLETQDRSVPTSYYQLKQSAEKHNIQKRFREIIKGYLDLMISVKQNVHVSAGQDRYLVVCIDDIDMYGGDPLRIMQCIFRYFTLPNMIVLTSMNYDMLFHFILNRYAERTAALSNLRGMAYSKRELLCREQANDYLRKIIPHDLRIVMPSWKKSDYRNVCTKMVRLMRADTFADQEKGMQALFPRLYPGRVYFNLEQLSKKENPEISVKMLLFRMLADRLGIYLNPNGFKQHFMEPDGLRSTFELFDTLYLMQNIREHTQEGSTKYHNTENHDKIRENYKIILDMFYFTMLPNLSLDDEEAALFDVFSRATPDTRGRIIIDQYQKMRLNSRSNWIGGQKRDSLTKKGDYSIGELFRSIYLASREDVFSKQLVKAILASFSFILPYYFDESMFIYYKRLHEYSQQGDDQKKPPLLYDNKHMRTLFSFVGGSLLGNWAYELFGNSALRVRFQTSELGSGVKLNTLFKMLMFIRIDKLSEQETISFTTDPSTKAEYELNFDMDLTAFLINIIRIDDFTACLEKMIHFAESEENEKYKKAVVKELKGLKSKFQEFSGASENSDKLEKQYPLFPFPVHQVDLAYSIVKRAVREQVYLSDNELQTKPAPKETELVSVMEKFYSRMFDELVEVQECYPILDQYGKDTSAFAKNFAEAGEQLGIWKLNQTKGKLEKGKSKLVFTDDNSTSYLIPQGITWKAKKLDDTTNNINEDSKSANKNINNPVDSNNNAKRDAAESASDNSKLIEISIQDFIKLILDAETETETESETKTETKPE